MIRKTKKHVALTLALLFLISIFAPVALAEDNDCLGDLPDMLIIGTDGFTIDYIRDQRAEAATAISAALGVDADNLYLWFGGSLLNIRSKQSDQPADCDWVKANLEGYWDGDGEWVDVTEPVDPDPDPDPDPGDPRIVVEHEVSPPWSIWSDEVVVFNVVLENFPTEFNYTVGFDTDFGSITGEELSTVKDGRVVVEEVEWYPPQVTKEETGNLIISIKESKDAPEYKTVPAKQVFLTVTPRADTPEGTIYYPQKVVADQADRVLVLFDKPLEGDIANLLVNGFRNLVKSKDRVETLRPIDFKLADIKIPRLVDAWCQGGRLYVEFSESVNDFTAEEAEAEALRQIDDGLYWGTFNELYGRIWGSSVRNLTTWTVDGASLQGRNVTVEVLHSKPSEYTRDLVRLTFNDPDDYDRFLRGETSRQLQVNTLGDWAAVTDRNNIVVTQETSYLGCPVVDPGLPPDPECPGCPEVLWWMDGKPEVYGDDGDWLNESPEQFIVEVFPPETGALDLSDMYFEIFVPDNGDYVTPHMILEEGVDFVVNNLPGNRYLLELTEDWTVLFDTDDTAEAYHQARFNPIRLYAYDIRVTTADATLFCDRLRANEDIRLRDDTQSPFITHWKDLSQVDQVWTPGVIHDAVMVDYRVFENFQVFDMDREINVSNVYIPEAQNKGVMLVLDRTDAPGLVNGTQNGEEFGGHFPLTDNAFHRVVIETETGTLEDQPTPEPLVAYDGTIYLEMNEPVQWRDQFGFNTDAPYADMTAPLTPSQDQGPTGDDVDINTYRYVRVDADEEDVFGSIRELVSTGYVAHGEKNVTDAAVAAGLTDYFPREAIRDYAAVIQPNVPLTPGTWELVVTAISDDVGNTMATWRSPAFEVTADAVPPTTLVCVNPIPSVLDNPDPGWNYPYPDKEKDVIHITFSNEMMADGPGSVLRRGNYTLNGVGLDLFESEIQFGIYDCVGYEDSRASVTIFLERGALQEQLGHMLTIMNVEDAQGRPIGYYQVQIPYNLDGCPECADQRDFALLECDTWTEVQSGGFGVTIDTWDISAVETGAVIDIQFNAFGIPDKFVVEYDGVVVLDTGWRGDAGFEGDPLYPGGIAGPGAGQEDEILTKLEGVDELTVTVYGPDEFTAWNYALRCRVVEEVEPDPDIVDVAIAGGFSELVGYVQLADLEDALRGAGPFTVFAPTNDAFEDLLDELEDGAADFLLDPDNEGVLVGILTELLTYHVVAGEFTAADLLADVPTELTTLQGDTLEITEDNGSLFVNGLEIDPADIFASNGVIHVINEVLLPPVAIFIPWFENLPDTVVIDEQLDPDIEFWVQNIGGAEGTQDVEWTAVRPIDPVPIGETVPVTLAPGDAVMFDDYSWVPLQLGEYTWTVETDNATFTKVVLVVAPDQM